MWDKVSDADAHLGEKEPTNTATNEHWFWRKILRIHSSRRLPAELPSLLTALKSQAPFGVFRLSLTLLELRNSGSIPDKAIKDCAIYKWRNGVVVTCFSFR
jgi:hypothetical protein